MWLILLAWKNMWRNRHRTLLTLAGVFFAVLLSVLASSLKEGIFNNLIRNVVGYHTGYIQVHRKGYWNERTLEYLMPYTTDLLSRIQALQNIASAAPRLETFTLINAGAVTKGCMITGIDPDAEKQTTALDTRLTKGSYFQETNAHAVLVAEELARLLKITTGDTVYLFGQGYQGSIAAGKYTVCGILHFGSPDLNRSAVYLPLGAAQEFLSAGTMLSSIAITIRNTRNLAATAAAVQTVCTTDIEVMTWEEMLPDIRQHIATDSRNMFVIQLILYLLVSFGIISTLMMMMMERKFENGMLLSVGMKKRQLAFILGVEALLTVVTGCIAGLVVSLPVTVYFREYPLRISGETARAYERFGFEPVFPASTDPALYAEQGLIILILGLCLSLYPVYQVFRTNALRAMKR